MPRPFLGRTARRTVRLPPEDAVWVAARAADHGCTVNDLIVAWVRKAHNESRNAAAPSTGAPVASRGKMQSGGTMIHNLCHFDVVLGEVRCPAHPTPLRFSPILAGDGPIRTLLGYAAPADLPPIPTGASVIVPRFAAAVSWALAAGLVPFCVPQKHLGERGRPGAPELVLNSIDDLEPAAQSLGFEFPKAALPAPTGMEAFWTTAPGIQRLVQGAWVIHAPGVGIFAPVQDNAYDRPDGSAYIPHIDPSSWAVIVPQSGPIIRAVEAARPDIVILVTGVPNPVTKEVDLYRVR